MKPVWVIDDDKSIRWVFEKALTRENIEYKSFASAQDALTALNNALLLGAVYFLLLWPFGLVLRAAARLHYRTGFDPAVRSYRVPVDPGHTTDLEEPF